MVFKSFKWAEREFLGRVIQLTPPAPPDDLREVLGTDLAIGWAGVMARAIRPLPRSTIAFYMGVADPRSYNQATAQMGKVWRMATTKLKKSPVIPDEWHEWVAAMVDELTAFDLLIRRPNRRRKLIAVAGPPGVGKRQVAGWLADITGGRIIHFADAVERVAKNLHYLDDKTPECRRQVLDTLALTLREFYADDYMLYGFASMYEHDILAGEEWLIVDDLQFWNEHLWVQAAAGTTLKINRPGYDYPPAYIDPFREGYEYHKGKKLGRRWLYAEINRPGGEGAFRHEFNRVTKYFAKHIDLIDATDMPSGTGWPNIRGLKRNDVKDLVTMLEMLDRHP